MFKQTNKTSKHPSINTNVQTDKYNNKTTKNIHKCSNRQIQQQNTQEHTQMFKQTNTTTKHLTIHLNKQTDNQKNKKIIILKIVTVATITQVWHIKYRLMQLKYFN